jgi:hypothetical protein
LPYILVLESWPEDGEIVVFKLLFRGHLPSEDKATVEVKHNIRKQLHPQLREVWQGHPSLCGSFKTRKNGISRVEEIARDFSKCGFRFVPLIRKKENACSLNIRKRTGCTVLTEATLGVYGRLGRWMRRED